MVTKNSTVLKQAFFKIASNIYNSIAYVLLELRKLTIQRVRENRVGGDERNMVQMYNSLQNGDDKGKRY